MVWSLPSPCAELYQFRVLQKHKRFCIINYKDSPSLKDRDENKHKRKTNLKKADNAENIRKHQNSDQFPWRQEVLYLLDDRGLLKISKNKKNF